MTVLIVITTDTFELARYEGTPGNWHATHHAVINDEYRDQIRGCLDQFRCDPPAVFRVEGSWTPTVIENATDI